MNTGPIKRKAALKPFSRDHHHGLLLCWKIREGINLKVAPERIKRYTDWFWNTHLQRHFKEEEQYIFPVLPTQDVLVIQALHEHKSLKNLFERSESTPSTLKQLEKELNKHIRFEERILFNKIQQAATPEQLKIISEVHHDVFCDDWEDEFWKTSG